MNYTKAGMLLNLKENIPTLNILPLLVIQSQEFLANPDSLIRKILCFAEGKNLIVRSSSKAEDTDVTSNAGKFVSILYVKPEEKEIKEAVQKVYQSYQTSQNEEILIQPMLSGIKKSGVVFTADMDTYADYYIINYHEGEDTSAVTSGSSGHLKTYIHYKFSSDKIADSDIESVVDICKKIERFLAVSALDIEFAITSNNQVCILQVRPIAKGKKCEIPHIDLSLSLERIYKKVMKLSKKHPFLLGDTTCFGVMPDWNPAEILGVRPKKMAISLYKELITDYIWAHQRKNYGYRDVTMHPLMVSFCGIPYIDTRITFNSFIPADLNVRIAEKLVNFYLTKLEKYPKYHDKIEFEIVYSCYYFGLPHKLTELLDYGFNENELKRIEFSLLNLTNNIINPQNGLCKQDIHKISILNQNFKKIMDSDISLIDKIYWLIMECKEYGTLPFAGVARAGFIAIQFLKSFVEMDIISQEDYHAFMNSLDTINKKMNGDLKAYYQGNLAYEDFLSQYGHIRPGTYDILSKRYDEAFNEYFGENIFLTIDEKETVFEFSEDVMDKINLELEQNGLSISAKELISFIKEAIEGREYSKFAFTRLVSQILKLIEELGNHVGIAVEDMAYLDISVVMQLYTDLYVGDIETSFRENIRQNKLQYHTALQIKLPSIIVNPKDIYSFSLLGEEPNFITQKTVTSEVITLSSKKADIRGKIVCIQSADPGYDFLFSQNIGGLITQFGGVNSHMAIRCAELGIPAIIGVGEKNFMGWSKCTRLTIDCEKKQVIVIQ
ncbi:MAG: phosphoenolpyruvate synthase [Lachnospiraceae bacterium]|nr:phosphoenolpyruvate synthase [Lachnospiraceae bacterium]